MRDAVQYGVGSWNESKKRRDVQLDFDDELRLAMQPAQLVDHLDEKLTYGTMPAALKQEIAEAVSSIEVPARNANGSNAEWIRQLQRNRVRSAILLTLVSPEFIVQK
jgi:hypothetical protein